MLIRTRSRDDIPELIGIADAVRTVDRWPPHRVGPTEQFIAGTPELSALVAVDHRTLLGHVALHDRSAESVMQLAEESLGVERASVAVVARLFVAPSRRHGGVGRSLLDAAAADATRLHRHPILDVWVELEDAIAMYDAAGWQRLGTVVFSFKSPCGADCLHEASSLESFVYAAPPTTATSR